MEEVKVRGRDHEGHSKRGGRDRVGYHKLDEPVALITDCNHHLHSLGERCWRTQRDKEDLDEGGKERQGVREGEKEPTEDETDEAQ